MASDDPTGTHLARYCLGLSDARPHDPGSPALSWSAGTLHPIGLRQRVDEVATLLRGAVSGTSRLVTLPADRSPDSVVGVLGALAARVPFAAQPTGTPVPPWCRAQSAGHLGVTWALGGEAWEPVFTAASPQAPVDLPDSTAYVMATSGTGGRPHAAVVDRGGLRQVFGALYRQFGELIPAGARWSHAHALTFGFSMCEILGAVTFGGEIVVVPGASPFSSGAWERALAGTAPVVACITPSELSVLCGRLRPLAPHLYLILSGEAAYKAPLARLFAQTSPDWLTVINTYAATETSGQICAEVVTAATVGRTILGYVGRPLPGVSVHVDGDGVGEISVSGPTVGPGYLDPDATAERFDVDADGAARFHTRDLGRWEPDGGLVVLGRVSSAVKLGARWLNLDELERALSATPGIRDAVCALSSVGTDGTERHDALLVAVVPDGSTTAGPGTHRDEVALRRAVLHALDVPATVQLVVVDELPRPGNGKADRSAALRLAPDPAMLGPGAEVRQAVLGAWRAVLGAGTPLDGDLFDVGVDSLGVVAVAAILSAALGRRIGAEFLVSHPTLAEQISALTHPETVGGVRAREGMQARQAISQRRRLARAAARTGER